MKQFLRNNINFLAYFVFAIILELSTLFVITDALFIKSPWLALTLLVFIFSIYNFIKGRTAKNAILYTFSIIQLILCLFCVILYDNTGTLFDFNMFQLVGESTTFLGTLTINYGYIVYILLLLAALIISINILNRFQDKYYRCKFSIITSSVCLVIFLISHISIVVINNNLSREKFMNNLYVDSNEKYIQMGQTSNFLNEIYKMAFFNKYNTLKQEEIEEYIYAETNEPTSMFAISKDNNLITILVESFEWFSFISDPSIYPNGANINNDILDKLYPNIRKFYNMSVVMNNHHSQNKTDMSEDEALLGVYPSSDYINYIYPFNSYPTSIANTFKLNNEEISNNYAHNNVGTYYNRNKIIKSFGYDNLYFIDDMVENGATDYMANADLTGVAMNLDSEMIETMKDKLFLTDQRFNTHLTTISTHGHFVHRNTMQKWEDKMTGLGVIISDESLKNYMVYTMEFDYALGLMLEDLNKKDLLDNTTIVIFSDHNTYLSNLTYNVKGIEYKNYNEENYNELFRLPLMIYDPNINHQIINKFTTTYDIVPTILDMFGINYYTNLYHGNSIFSDTSSVLYSKAFDIFIAEGLLFSNINNILYRDDNVSESYIKEIEDKCLKLLNKIYYTNHIFYYNYFGDTNNYAKYINNFKSIN